jgi:hypothetical protein
VSGWGYDVLQQIYCMERMGVKESLWEGLDFDGLTDYERVSAGCRILGGRAGGF